MVCPRTTRNTPRRTCRRCTTTSFTASTTCSRPRKPRSWKSERGRTHAMNAGELLAQLRVNGLVPRHVAIIMDGNGRWARERLMPRPFGHRSGMKAVRAVVEAALEVGLEYLSLFAFSQENWQRPTTEVSALMSLLEEYIARESAEL